MARGHHQDIPGLAAAFRGKQLGIELPLQGGERNRSRGAPLSRHAIRYRVARPDNQKPSFKLSKALLFGPSNHLAGLHTDDDWRFSAMSRQVNTP
ncbi:MAG: hypothetical protein AB8E74_08840 [Prochlorococcus sp.]